MMADVQSIFYISEVNGKRDPVCFFHFPETLNRPIASRICMTSPQPTSVCLFDVLKESFQKWESLFTDTVFCIATSTAFAVKVTKLLSASWARVIEIQHWD